MSLISARNPLNLLAVTRLDFDMSDCDSGVDSVNNEGFIADGLVVDRPNRPPFAMDSHPYEIAVTLATGQRYHAWVKPSHYALQQMPDHIAAVLNTLGKPILQVCNELNTLCEGTNILCDDWWLTCQWLDNLFAAADVSRGFLCSPIEALLNEQEQGQWGTHKQFVLDILDANEYSANAQLDVMHAAINLFYCDNPQSYRPAMDYVMSGNPKAVSESILSDS